MPKNRDVYFIQKIALQPFCPNFSIGSLNDTMTAMSLKTREQVFSCIKENNLGPLWIEILGSENIEQIWSKEQTQDLVTQYQKIIALYFLQQKTIREITILFEKNSITHTLIKGAHTREIAYTTPSARPSVDIDVLISGRDRTSAINLLTSEGFTLQVNPKNSTHEVDLIKNQTYIDLHWHILRPGRVPKDLTDELLKNSEKNDSYWSLNPEDNFFILLTHPVFTKYISSTRTGLIRFVDLIYWLNTQRFDWERVYALLQGTGLSSAAWITLDYLRVLTGKTAPDEFTEKIAPSVLKRWYLKRWIRYDMPGKFQHTPLVPKIFFTPFGQDNWGQFFQLIYNLLPERKKVHSRQNDV